MFRLFDSDKDGRLERSEVTTACRAIGLSLDEKELHRLIRDIQERESNIYSGRLTFAQFLQLIQRSLTSVSAAEEELLSSFKILDGDNSGYVSASELKDVLGRIGHKIPEAEFEQILKEADIDGDGKLSYNEFVYLLMAKAV